LNDWTCAPGKRLSTPLESCLHPIGKQATQLCSTLGSTFLLRSRRVHTLARKAGSIY
jgi:hypothetical protein